MVCPMVEASEAMEAENVIIEYSPGLPGAASGLYSGGISPRSKMKPKEKMRSWSVFLKRDPGSVSTTVVEVGANVPNATVMMIENAELRVTRPSSISFAEEWVEAASVLLYSHVRKRRERRQRSAWESNRSNDGFYIAEEDLKLRGPGDFFGIRGERILISSWETFFRRGDP